MILTAHPRTVHAQRPAVPRAAAVPCHDVTHGVFDIATGIDSEASIEPRLLEISINNRV